MVGVPYIVLVAESDVISLATSDYLLEVILEPYIDGVDGVVYAWVFDCVFSQYRHSGVRTMVVADYQLEICDCLR